ncbi:hypothetical protein LF1_33790 [Rubripirellula obstinata]|uniref:DUF3311 domain-containing protein n=1 Tax=Rubripirellula obstinata TaxID=406547 RepID=A0A5B1CI09_9BACT|nr:DUF3311 domain-containing protein [Rubripirellula obstinata]KAA1260837.1 hypothetical protein LF1_33790 [Rubripirellula obstinata]
MKYLVWGLIAFLVVIHQDVWNWNNDTLVFGFIPLTLAYHAGISIAASVVWLIAATTAWPVDSDDSTGDLVAGDVVASDSSQESSI